MPNRRTRIKRRMGRRGAVLSGLSVVCFGMSIATIGNLGFNGYPLLGDTPWLRVAQCVMWTVAGVLAAVSALAPVGKDRAGWVAVYVACSYRCVAYGHGVVTWLWGKALAAYGAAVGATDAEAAGYAGNPEGVAGMLAWGGILWLIVVCSGWTEPHPGAPPLENDE